MTAPITPPSAAREHQLEWNDRLQDWLDGDLDATETAALQAHMADCASCRARAEELQQLDRSLCRVGATGGQRGFSFVAAPPVDSAAYDVHDLVWKGVTERARVVTHRGLG